MNPIIEKAFSEDIPNGDVTTLALGVKEKFGYASLIAKQDLILSGHKLFTECLNHCDPDLKANWHFLSGDEILAGQTVAKIEGNLISLIQAERVALNFLGYLSGIATQTAQFVAATRGTSCRILDTRKTLPLYRNYAKQAVVDGGGTNHRMTLSDAILIKENHINIAGSLESCLTQIKAQSTLPIEVEVKNIDEVKKALEHKVSRIMLDNMSLDEMREAVAIIKDQSEIEASGNMTLDRIPAVAALGVHFISVGALTHSVPNADLSLLFEWNL